MPLRGVLVRLPHPVHPPLVVVAMTQADDTHARLDKLIDANARLITKLGAADATIWRARELLLEVVTLAQENDPYSLDLIRRQDRLLLEISTFLSQTPDVIRLPRNSGEAAGTGEGPAASPALGGDAA